MCVYMHMYRYIYTYYVSEFEKRSHFMQEQTLFLLISRILKTVGFKLGVLNVRRKFCATSSSSGVGAWRPIALTQYEIGCFTPCFQALVFQEGSLNCLVMVSVWFSVLRKVAQSGHRHVYSAYTCASQYDAVMYIWQATMFPMTFDPPNAVCTHRNAP